jgi:hypothetical protein
VKRWHVVAVTCAVIAIAAYLAMIVGPHFGRRHESRPGYTETR